MSAVVIALLGIYGLGVVLAVIAILLKREDERNAQRGGGRDV